LEVEGEYKAMTTKLGSSAAGAGAGAGSASLTSRAAADNTALDKLYDMKLQKVKEQKDLADKMNDILTKHGGLNESSKLTRKSLQAAIAVAKQPGLQYHL
jgi:hypothetical protein